MERLGADGLAASFEKFPDEGELWSPWMEVEVGGRDRIAIFSGS